MNNKVVIVIPTYRRTKTLGRAIDSVLKQTYKNIEVCVVDDNNEGDTFRRETEVFMQQYKDDQRVIYIKHDFNRNGSFARNTGIKSSSGEYIAFLDDDDFYEETKIQKQVIELDSQASDGPVQCIGCLSKVINGFSAHHSKKETANTDFFDNVLLGKVHFNTSTLMFKRAVLEELGGFDEMLKRYQDVDLLVRYTHSYQLMIINEPLVILDQHDRANYSNLEALVEAKQYLEQKYLVMAIKPEIWDLYLKANKRDIIKAALFNRNWGLFFKSFSTKPYFSITESFSFFFEMASKALTYKLNN